MSYKRKCGCVYTDGKDATVRKGFEVGGSIKKFCDKHLKERMDAIKSRKEFVSEIGCERLAKKHIENFMNDCRLQKPEDAKQAARKMVAVSMHLLDTIENGEQNTVQ